MRRLFRSTSFAFLALVIACVPASAGNVRVSMHEGRVDLSAQDVTLKDILDAWTRAGGTSFVHLDGVTMTERITLELTDVKEEDALAVLLRPLSGYLTVKRAPAVAGTSEFDRVVLVPTSVVNHDSTVVNTPAMFAAPPTPAPTAARPPTVIVNGVSRIVGPNGALVDDDQIDAPPPRAPQGFNRGDAPPAPPPQARPAAPNAPTTVGSTVPGIINPPPAPATPAAPAQR